MPAIVDKFYGAPAHHLTGPFYRAVAVNPSDNVDLAELPRALYVGVAGDVTVILSRDTVAVLFKAVPAGTILPVRARRVLDTGTTPGNGDILALY